MTNEIKKQCPTCQCPNSDILFAIIIEDVSYNVYKCVARNHRFNVKRKGDKKEQALTEKYIQSEEITLK